MTIVKRNWTLERLQSLYNMPNATMQELSQEAERRANEKIKEYLKKYYSK